MLPEDEAIKLLQEIYANIDSALLEIKQNRKQMNGVDTETMAKIKDFQDKSNKIHSSIKQFINRYDKQTKLTDY